MLLGSLRATGVAIFLIRRDSRRWRLPPWQVYRVGSKLDIRTAEEMREGEQIGKTARKKPLFFCLCISAMRNKYLLSEESKILFPKIDMPVELLPRSKPTVSIG